VQAGADVYHEDHNQRIALDEAVLSDRPAIVDLLLSHDPSQIQCAYRASVIAARLGNVPCPL
jgi:hypothetical protein